jgi:hypothetical protein
LSAAAIIASHSAAFIAIGFSQKNVFAPLRRRHGDLAVHRGGCGDEDALHGTVVEQRAVVRVVGNLAKFVFRRRAGRRNRIGNGRDARASHEPGEVARVDHPSTARADDPDADN